MQLFSIITLFANIAVAATILTERDAPIGQAHVDDFLYTGSGCGPATTAVVLAEDLTMLGLLYNALTVETGPGIAPGEAFKDCQATVVWQIPQGWQFSIAKVDIHGYANVSEGVTATADALYQLSGSSQTVRVARSIGQDRHALLNTKQTASSISFQGPFDDSFIKTNVFTVESTLWSPCGLERILLHVNSRNQISPLDTKQPAKLGVCSNRANVCRQGQ